MYRTATTRILHLCSGDPFSPSCPLRVKHIVPSGPAYGSVAWTSTCNSHSATFYTKTVAPTEEPMGHRVVVIDRDGEGNEQHHLYRVSELRYGGWFLFCFLFLPPFFFFFFLLVVS